MSDAPTPQTGTLFQEAEQDAPRSASSDPSVETASANVTLTERLDAKQREAVLHPGPTVRILAGPGSGKTRVLTSRVLRRIDDGSADPRHVLTLTFTRRAARELRDRLRRGGVRDITNVGTFHGVALQQLRQHRADRGKLGPEVVANRAATLRSIAKSGPDVSSMISEIERAAARGLTASGLAQRRGDSAAAELFKQYETHKKRNGLLDFDDILRECTTLLLHDDQFARAQRWRFRHLFVDEFQDVNQTQFELLQAWLGQRDDLCVVGDADQAIYGWNGADATYLTNFTKWFPAAFTITLDTNHRSAAPVVAAATAVLGSRDVTVRKQVGPQPTVSDHESPHDEALSIADRIRWRHGDGGSWSSHAVLARTNAQLDTVAEALRSAAVPFRLRGRSGASRSAAADAVLAALSSSESNFGTTLIDLEMDDSLDDDGLSMLELAREYAAGSGAPSGMGFTQWMRTLRAADTREGPDAVDLVTFHAAKGLEWRHIYIIGFEDGLVPMNAGDEDRRLAYVALTRAELSIHLSWCRLRARGGLMERRSPSPWLEAIEANNAPPVPARAEQVDSHLDQARSATDRRSSTDTRDRLVAWRAVVAGARRIDPQAVLRDDHVDAALAGNPRSIEDLCSLTGLSKLRLRNDGQAILDLINS